MMTLIKKILFGIMVSIVPLISLTVTANDLMDTVFQPSKNLDQVINIGTDKNAVGNEVFRGSTSAAASVGFSNACYTFTTLMTESNCKKSTSTTWENNKCYNIPAKDVKNESECNQYQNAERTKLTYLELQGSEPLIVRITKTLLRITIALAVPVLIYIGVKLISSAMSGGNIKEAFKEVSGVIIGLILALSAMGIIYLIQSIALNSLSGT